MSKLTQLKQELEQRADSKQQKLLQGFFKTGKGEYGEGDRFLGIKVPVQRKVAKKYYCLPLTEIQKLLHSPIHEYRLTSLLLLINGYVKATAETKKNIFEFYLNNANHINNWDLVDISAPQIVGDYLLDKPNKPREILYQLAQSDHLWKKRIAIIATFTFIRHDQFDDTLKLAEILRQDQHDLIHKAVGWMLREVGKRNLAVEEAFLDQYYHEMPRTMLRYAIEKFEEEKRQFYLSRKKH